MTAAFADDELGDLLASVRERYDVPGAVLGIATGDDTRVLSSGRALVPSGAATSPETLFLIASITKVWTATLVMQLVDERLVALDSSVNRYLDPPLRLVDHEAASAVTVRQLLTHSAGFAGDAAEPDWCGDDAVALMTASYRTLEQLHRPGRLFSYSNTGYNVLGRLVECVRGTTWDNALDRHLLSPLGLESTFTDLNRAATHPLAVGHEPSGDGPGLVPVSLWRNPRGSGPCGGTVATTARDLLEFAWMHLRDGVGRNGRRVLSVASATGMRQRQMPYPGHGRTAWWGLGWSIERDGSPYVVGHEGSTCGQQSRLVLVPERDLAVCVLTNGDPYGQLGDAVTTELLERLAGLPPTLEPATPQGPPAPPPDFDGCLGRYGHGGVVIEISDRDGGLSITFETSGEASERLTGFTTPLRHVDGASYEFAVQQQHTTASATFVNDDDGGAPTHVAIGTRVLPRLRRS